MRDDVLHVARRELAGFFHSPVAYLFLAAFLAVSLFVFFWVETFFARNIADLKPLFKWMPVLLIFLVSALTMRLWSEERRAGTLEVLLTTPVPPTRLVLGKFLAAWALVAVALALTLPLPVTVSLLGPLDWGPVFGGYLAALLLAAAYIAMGLFVSARTDNGIVALIGTAALCGGFYLVGSDTLTTLFGRDVGEVMALVGTGARFDSITRGVIDLRDLYYYGSLVGAFLALNVYLLERLRWAHDGGRAGHRRLNWTVALVAANFLAANLWLAQVPWLRADLTENNAYSLSATTHQYLNRLQEPLVIRGYFSEKTHPLLAPQVPQLRDLLREYEVAGGERVRVEFLDPHADPKVEREAGEKYGVKPTTFQTASKYQSSVVNSYFNIVVQYGDQFEKLGYQDLIEAKVRGEGDVDVRLRNPEYDITRAIKKALNAYRGGGGLLEGLDGPATVKAFLSPTAQLPQPLADLRGAFESWSEEKKDATGGRLKVQVQNPAEGGLADTLREEYGFRPMTLGLTDPSEFWFYIVLEADGRSVTVPLPDSLDAKGLKRNLSDAFKRLKTGVLRTIALYTPQPTRRFRGPQYQQLQKRLRDGARLVTTDLKSGQVPGEADLLLVVDPSSLSERQLFAIDQFLMQGGSVVVAGAPFDVNLAGGRIDATQRPTGLGDWLQHFGITQKEALVLDPQNTPFPIPVERQVQGYTVREVRDLDYPYFPDIRPDGMDEHSGIAAGLGQITLTWASPFRVDEKKNAERKVVPLLKTSADSALTKAPQVQPDFQQYPETGFPEGTEVGRQTVALAVEGRFTSYFEDKPSPLAQGQGDAGDEPGEAKATKTGQKDGEEAPTVTSVVESSPPSARLVLLGSGTALGDTALDLAAKATGTRYLKPVRFVENAIDWSIEDRGLLALRGQGHYARMLAPVGQEGQRFWEYLNYGLALLGLALAWGVHRWRAAVRTARHRAILRMSEGRAQ